MFNIVCSIICCTSAFYTAPSDYDVNSTNIVLSASKKTESVFVSIINDEVIELDERFYVRIEVIGELANHVQLVQKEAEIIILNDDGTVHVSVTYSPLLCK